MIIILDGPIELNNSWNARLSFGRWTLICPVETLPEVEKARGAPVSRSAPLCSGRKPNSVPARLLKAHRRWSFISRADRSARAAPFSAHATDTRDGPGTFVPDRAGNPASLFGLAPHGVYRAPAVTRRAVGFYPAFSPLPRRPIERVAAVCFL